MMVSRSRRYLLAEEKFLVQRRRVVVVWRNFDRLALGAGLLVGSCGLSLSSPVEAQESCQPEDVGLRLFMQELQVLSITSDDEENGDRDEPYIVVKNETPAPISDVLGEQRLPFTEDPFDYYGGFVAGRRAIASNPLTWSNHEDGDRPQRPFFPEIWEGRMDEETRGDFRVQVWEKDTEFSGAAQDELIGEVLVTLENSHGNLNITFDNTILSTRFVDFPESTIPINKSINSVSPFGTIVRQTFLAEPENDARYVFELMAEKICLRDGRIPFRHRLYSDDVENGNCDNGQPATVVLEFNRRDFIPVGEYIYQHSYQAENAGSLDDQTVLPSYAGLRRIQYICNGREWIEPDPERFPFLHIFEREYNRFLIERTQNEIRYNPYRYVTFGVRAGIGGLVSPLLEEDLVDRGKAFVSTPRLMPIGPVGQPIWETPERQHNTASGDIRVAFDGSDSVFRVVIPNMASYSGQVQISTYFDDSDPEQAGMDYCKVVGWGPASSDLEILVRCFANDGTPLTSSASPGTLADVGSFNSSS